MGNCHCVCVCEHECGHAGQNRDLYEAPDAPFAHTYGRPVDYIYRRETLLCTAEWSPEAVAPALEEYGVSVVDICETSYGFLRVTVSLPDGLTIDRLVDLLASTGRVMHPDHVMSLSSHVDIGPHGAPLPQRPAGLAAAGQSKQDVLGESFETETFKPRSGKMVAVFDTPVIRDTPLENRVNPDSAFGPKASGPTLVTYGHGHFVAGLILNLAPDANVRVVDLAPFAGDGDYWGRGALTDDELATALTANLEWLVEVHVVNLSLAGPTHSGALPATTAVLDELREHNPEVRIVAAAGNNKSTDAHYPAALEYVCSVGATTSGGADACFTNRGDWVDTKEVGQHLRGPFPAGEVIYDLSRHQPGIYCSDLEDYNIGPSDPPKNVRHFQRQRAYWNGTSFAAALVSGRIAAGGACCEGDGDR